MNKDEKRTSSAKDLEQSLIDSSEKDRNLVHQVVETLEVGHKQLTQLCRGDSTDTNIFEQSYRNIEVLLIEDDPDDIVIIHEMLDEAIGVRFNIVDADRLHLGLDIISQRDIDIILTDLDLPDSVGLATLHEVVSAAKAVPIIALTGMSDQSTAVQAVAFGAQDYLVKGRFDGDLVMRSIDYAMERKRMESELQQKEHFFRSLIENSQDAIVIIDQSGKYIYASPSYTHVLGYETGDMIGEDACRNVHPDDMAKVGKAVSQLLFEHPHGVVHTEIRVQHQDGRWLYIKLVANNLIHDSAVGGVVVNLQDITEQKQAEEAASLAMALEEAEHLRRAFLTNVSHEVRTPLASIKGLASTLAQPNMNWDPEIQLDFLDSICEESDRLLRIFTDVLDMSKISADTMEWAKDIVKPETIISRIESTLHDLASGHNLVLRLEDDLPAVMMDNIRISQVITSLVRNAATYSQSASTIELEVKSSGDTLTVSVTDQGDGIATEHLERVFEPFFRVTVTDKRRRSGAGLGLAISRGIVDAHGGIIWAESELGEGSKICFSLPIVDDSAKS